jgi:uncharacterized protein
VKLVLDTNVLVSGMLGTGSPPARILDLLRAREVRLVVDDRILAEYADVLGREYLRHYFPEDAARDVMEFLRHDSELVICTVVIRHLPDPGDIPFLEVALAAGAPLITGNKRHFPAALARSCRILTPREFVDTLG